MTNAGSPSHIVTLTALRAGHGRARYGRLFSYGRLNSGLLSPDPECLVASTSLGAAKIIREDFKLWEEFEPEARLLVRDLRKHAGEPFFLKARRLIHINENADHGHSRDHACRSERGRGMRRVRNASEEDYEFELRELLNLLETLALLSNNRRICSFNTNVRLQVSHRGFGLDAWR